MLNLSPFCFLSRPRRFGKSLLIDTIDELFRGDRKLFEGLWIDMPNKFDFRQHPVLNLCMTYTEINQKSDLIDRISDDLLEVADEEDVKITAKSYGEILGQLLKRLSKKFGAGIVILIDEYDSPVTDNITNRDLALDCRNVLHDFYRAMKKYSKYIKFALVTGITRFAMVSLDSGPNNFMDISLHPKFSGICGFTPQELETYFSDRFTDAIAKLKPSIATPTDADFKELTSDILEWYDGYNWLGPDHILNPYSIFNFIENFEFDSYWPRSGHPSHLTALVRENPRDYMLPSLEAYAANEVRKCDVANLSPIPVLFHSGYLTIEHKTTILNTENNKVTEIPAFTFKIPNTEVRLQFEASIFNDAFKPKPQYLSNLTKCLPSALVNKNSQEVSRLLHDLLTSISYYQHPSTKQDSISSEISLSEQSVTSAQLCEHDHPITSSQLSIHGHSASSQKPAGFFDITNTEKYYHAILHGAFHASGFEVHSEGTSANGRTDIVLFLNNKIRIVIELKYCISDLTTRETDTMHMFSENGKTISHSETNMNRAYIERATKELSAALDRGQNQITDLDYAGPYRAAGCAVICMALAIRNHDEVAVRFFEYQC
jgi:hypothetical protein